MTDRDTYEIIVDIDGWPASRAALSDVVAGVLGVPAHRIRPVLDVRDEPVATYAHQEEADRVADELAAKGIDVAVRRRLRRRRSLEELTRRAVTMQPREEDAIHEDGAVAKAPTDAREQVAAHAGTMTPGWAALDDSGASPAHAGTAVGLPGWSVSADSGTMAPIASPLRLRDEPADVDPVQVARQLLAAEATADTVDPTNAGEWGEILGSALADRLVAGDEVRTGSPRGGGPAAPPVPVAPRQGDTKDLAPYEQTMAPPAGATTQHPGDLRREHAGASAPPEVAGSAWSVAGVDVAEPLAPAALPVDATQMVAPRANEDVLAFAGFDEAALSHAPEAPQDGMTVGDKFVRLRQPSADELAGTPEPTRVFAWGIAAPGAGFAAMGEPSRGVNYLLGSFLVVPWVKGAVDASRFASEVKAGSALLQRKPDPLVLFVYVVGFWGIVAAAIALASALTISVPPPSTTDPGVVEIDSGSQTSEAEADSGTGPAVTAADVGAELDEGELRRQLNALIREARMACEEERYAECERLTGRALELDGRNREALILQVEAVSRGVRTVPERPPETENDRQPHRSPP